MNSILFVCTGNTCRSPMAEAFMRELIDNDPLIAANYYAESAGISAYEGDSASKEAVSVMRADWGIDISSHRAKVLTEERIKEACLILTMSESHKDYILSFYPEAADKIHTLKEYAGHVDYCDIPDPYGRSLSYYSQCSSEIRKAVSGLAEKLKKSR